MPDPAWINYVTGRQIRERLRRLQELEAFRQYLRDGVRSASPLLTDAVAAGMLDLQDVLRRMRPAPSGQAGGSVGWNLSRWQFRLAGRPPGEISSRGFEGRHRWMAARLRGEHDPRGRLGVRLDAGTLAIELGVGRDVITTHGGEMRLHLRHAIPEVLVNAIVGRPIDDLISHPLLDGRDYPVTDVYVDGDDTLIAATTGMSRIQLPSLASAR